MDGLIYVLNWISTGIALGGAYLISKQDFKGFYFWVVSNTFFCGYNLIDENYAGAILFFCYLLITLNGIYNTLKKPA